MTPTWYSSAGAPSSGTGTNGDFYVNTTNDDVYQKSGGSWGSPITNIKGATGATGTTGAAGATGPAGSAGPSNTIVTTDPATLTAGSWPDLTPLWRVGSNFVGRLINAITTKSKPVSTDLLQIGDSASSYAYKSSTLASIDKITFEPVGDIAPEFYWRANNSANTLSGGRYTVLSQTGLGTDTTTFTSVGTQAPLQGTDSDGNVYVQFDSTGGVATAMQQSGVASAFTFLHDGTISYTLMIIHDSPGGMSSGGVEQILDNSGDTSANNGISFKNRDDTTGFHGPFYGWGGGSSGQYCHMLSGAQDFNSGFVRQKEITVIRYFRGQHRAAISGITDTFYDITMLRNGVMTCSCVQNASYASGAPSFKLTIGENANSLANHWNGRLYELMIVKRALSDRQLLGLCAFASATYNVKC